MVAFSFLVTKYLQRRMYINVQSEPNFYDIILRGEAVIFKLIAEGTTQAGEEPLFKAFMQLLNLHIFLKPRHSLPLELLKAKTGGK